MRTSEIDAADQRWRDIGSGVMARTFIGAERFVTTTKSGPPMSDIKSRRVWSLTTGRVIDEAEIEDTPDQLLHQIGRAHV